MAKRYRPPEMKKAEDAGHIKTFNRSSKIACETPVQYLKGVGPARAALLSRLGINTVEDILYYFPWRYEDRKNLKKICDLRLGEAETVSGEVVSAEVITTPRKRMKIFELLYNSDDLNHHNRNQVK